MRRGESFTWWRPDSYAEFNTVLDLRESYEKCKQMGYTGAALSKCAAPKAGVWSNPAEMPGSY